jgi:hypothetical protein
LHSDGGAVSGRAAFRAGAAKQDVVCPRARALLDFVDRALEPLVRKRLDLPAVVAHEVVVVLAARVPRLVAGGALAGIDSLHESLFD